MVSDVVLVALIGAVPATLALFISWRNGVKADHAKAAATDAKVATAELTLRVDGRLDELLEETRKLARAEGNAEGIANEQARLAAGTPVTGSDALAAVHPADPA